MNADDQLGILHHQGLVYAAQGPATLRLAEQAGLVHGNATAKDVSKLTIMGIVNAADAIAALVGTLIGGYLVDKTFNWHYILSAYLVWQGLSFACFTLATNLWQLTLASLAWGLASTMPSLSTQAAMTWVRCVRVHGYYCSEIISAIIYSPL